MKLTKPHKNQWKVLEEAKRFNVLKCGRRFGKTILTENLAIIPALKGKTVGYWSPTYKDINKVWDGVKSRLYDVTQKKDEQLKQIKLVTGGQIDFWSMEEPNNGRGFSYHRAILDECEKARHLKDIWEQVIRATLIDYKGDAWFMSTPKFGNTYFKTTLYTNEQKFDNWKSWKFTSYDNPFLDPAEIEEAKKYDKLTFDCEYMAEDVDISNNPFAYAFSVDKHVGKLEYDPNYELHLSFDYNVDPLTAISSQYVEGEIRVIKEFRLSNSNIYEICERIKVEYPNALFLITGDATGRARSALTSGTMNYYTVIKQELNLSDGQMMQPTINPSIGDSRVLTNSILQNFNVKIDEDCKYLIEDLKYVEINDEGDIDKSKDKHRSHLMDCFVGETLIRTTKGQKRIDEINIGEYVITPLGAKKVIDKWDSVAKVFDVTFSDGTKIRCTKDHKYFVPSVGWIEIFNIFAENKSVCKLYTKESDLSGEKSNHITVAHQKQKTSIQDICTDKYGLTTSVKYRKTSTFTTRTTTQKITGLKTSNLYTGFNTPKYTCGKGLKRIRSFLKYFSRQELQKLQNGIEVKRGLNGIENTLTDLSFGKRITGMGHATSVQKNIKEKYLIQDSVQTTANQLGGENTSQTWQQENVSNAIKNLSHLNICQKDSVQESVLESLSHGKLKVVSFEYVGKEMVYDITVQDAHCFYANDILVHNCFRYLLNTFHADLLKIRENTFNEDVFN